jgi:membrane protein
VRDLGASSVATARDAYEHWRKVRAVRLGAGLAYYGLFAIVPLLVLAAALVGTLISSEETVAFVRGVIDGIPNIDPDAVAQDIVDQVTRSTSGLGLIGALSALVAASFLFVALQDALNVIWEAPVRVGLKFSIRRRVLAGGIALLTALFFISSFLAQAVVGFAEWLVPGDIPVFESLAGALVTAATWALGVGTITLLFRLLPYAAVSWRSAVIGAAITAVLVALGTSLIGAYISRFGTTSVSGAAGTIVAFLLWVYYEAQIVLGGAVLTKMLDDRMTSPGRDAPKPPS